MEILSLPGLTPFAEVHALQLKLLEERIANRIEDTLIFCEHPATVTRGRGLQRKGGLAREPIPYQPDPSVAEYFEIERGGDLTYHGPGQLVCYPIFRVEPKDIEKWIRRLEQSVMDVLFAIGSVQSQRIPDASGVWVNGKKIASIGISVRKWVSFHGIALNLRSTPAAWKHLGEPCGFRAELMTSLEEIHPDLRTIEREIVEAAWAKGFS
jgi:lipoate-protein ligase B